VVAAGLAVLAADTGRVLMLQRGAGDGDPAGGTWEFPGGTLDGDEAPREAAIREWCEETGLTLPAGEVTGTWRSSNGIYRGYVWQVALEDSVPIHEGRDEVTNPDDPDGDAVEALAWWEPGQLVRNPAVRPELLGDLHLVLPQITRLKGESPAVVKDAADLSDPNPVEAEHVRNQLLANYPAKALGWVAGARWIGPVQIPQERIDDDDMSSWAASHQKKRVKHFAREIEAGNLVHPVVAVQEPGDDKVKVIDGHHRTLAYRKLGRPVKAYVGFTGSDGGPWDQTHSYQFHHGADPANKADGGGAGPKAASSSAGGH
jgi:8-oxo-dGTP pyrophosphatase MutT (NUDIX family)